MSSSSLFAFSSPAHKRAAVDLADQRRSLDLFYERWLMSQPGGGFVRSLPHREHANHIKDEQNKNDRP